ncbi:hypothetical protein ES703_65592 [subsurface metagenome]
MSALILRRGSNGKITGRCDAGCYNATKERCVCCCGGINHGAGLNKAIDNVTEHQAEIVKNNEGFYTEFLWVQRTLW